MMRDITDKSGGVGSALLTPHRGISKVKNMMRMMIRKRVVVLCVKKTNVYENRSAEFNLTSDLHMRCNIGIQDMPRTT